MDIQKPNRFQLINFAQLSYKVVKVYGFFLISFAPLFLKVDFLLCLEQPFS